MAPGTHQPPPRQRASAWLGMATAVTAIVAADANAISLLFMLHLIPLSNPIKKKCFETLIGSAVHGVVFSFPKPKNPFALGHKRTFRNAEAMSALPPKADVQTELERLSAAESSRYDWMSQTIELGLDTFGDVTDDSDGKPLHPAQVIRNLVEEAVLADEVGVDFIGVGEHHRADFAVSSPEMVLAAIASRPGVSGLALR